MFKDISYQTIFLFFFIVASFAHILASVASMIFEGRKSCRRRPKLTKERSKPDGRGQKESVGKEKMTFFKNLRLLCHGG